MLFSRSVLVGCAASVSIVTAVTMLWGHTLRSEIEERRLVIVHGRSSDEVIRLRVGDVVQFRPFSLPVTPDFLDARLEVKLEGQQVLQEIGQVVVESGGEGRASLSAFLLARENGRTTATISVAVEDPKQNPKVADRYRTTYVVECTRE